MNKIGTYSLKLSVQDLFVCGLASVIFIYSLFSQSNPLYEGIIIISIYFSIFSEKFIQIMLVINGYIYALIRQIINVNPFPTERLFSLDFFVFILIIYFPSLIISWNSFFRPQKTKYGDSLINCLNIIIPIGSLFISLIHTISFNSILASRIIEIDNLIFLGAWYIQYIIILAFCYSISSVNFSTFFFLQKIRERVGKNKDPSKKKKGETVSEKYHKIRKQKKTKKPKYKGV